MQTPTSRPKVSIILPVYNAGNFLHKCVQSLISQTLEEIEIIIVLDCPTDGSDLVAKQYARQDQRIVIIENTENLRVGESRNKGIDAATGDYIGFCDHDDYAEPEMYERMYQNAILHQSDIVTCDVNSININGDFVKTVRLPMGEGSALRDTMLAAVLKINPHFGKTVWNVLFRRDLLNTYRLRFGDNRVMTSDDCLIQSKAYFMTDKVSHCPSEKGLYNHVGNPGSTLYQYFFLNMELVLNYIVDLDAFITRHVASADKLKFQYDLAHGTIRHLYTGLRREIKFKGWRHAWRMTRKAHCNPIVRSNLKPLFSFDGIRYATKQLPPTKLFFALLLYF